MEKYKPKQDTTNNVTPITKRKMEITNWVVGIIAGLLFIALTVWQVFFTDTFKSKDKEIDQNELTTAKDSSSINKTENKGNTTIGRDQINAGRDAKVENK